MSKRELMSSMRAFLILREEAVAFDEGRITVGEFCMRVLDRLELNIDAGEFISILDSMQQSRFQESIRARYMRLSWARERSL